MLDVLHDLPVQILLRREYAAMNQITGNLREPQLHLVEPRGVGRSEVKADLWVLFEKLADHL